MMKRAFLSMFAIVAVIISLACKDALLGPEYPIKEFGAYEWIVIATVDKATHGDGTYDGLKTFDITIKRSLKGKLISGFKLSGKAADEEAHAVCPVHLNPKTEYLLLLTKSGKGVELSRFSFPVHEGHQYYDDYIKQIEKKLTTKSK